MTIVNHKAIEAYDYVISEAEKDIRPSSIDKYAYKAYQKKAILMYDILCFKTAIELLDKAEEIVNKMDE
jgi:RecA-family ATPase